MSRLPCPNVGHFDMHRDVKAEFECLGTDSVDRDASHDGQSTLLDVSAGKKWIALFFSIEGLAKMWPNTPV